METILANIPFKAPPSWAIWERSLIDVMNQSIHPFLAKYTREDGTLIFRDDFGGIDGLDDAYESIYNWPLFYALGGDDDVLPLAFKEWNAITRQFTEYGQVYNEFEQGYDWFHQGEGYLYFYFFGLADPTISLNVERAKRFAGLYMNEDANAPNYDEKLNIIRCAHNGSRGPAFHQFDRRESYGYSETMKPYGLPFYDIPGINMYEELKDPENAKKMGQAMRERMGRGDVVANLAVTSLVTNAYLYTGDEKYKKWVEEYVGGWMEHTKQNNGILPDNVGPSGKIGEYMDGNWWGGNYGWTWPHGFYNVEMAALIAAQNAMLLDQNSSYLELPRSQIDLVMNKGIIKDNTLLVPYKYGAQGWFEYRPLAPHYPVSLWNMSMEEDDFQRIQKLRELSNEDWKEVRYFRNKHDDGHESPWICFLLGENPTYPEEILKESHSQVYHRLEMIRNDKQDPKTYNIHHWQQRNPVITEALIQLTLGAPQVVYNGGLLMARVRYFDFKRKRPGLPKDVAALVEKLEAEKTVLKLVNLSPIEDKEMIVQSGVFGEHQFTFVKYQTRTNGQVEYKTVEVNDKFFHIQLVPGAQITLDMGMKRFVNNPTYSLPW